MNAAGAPSTRLVPEPEAASLLARYGIAYPAHAVAHSAAEAAAIADALGYPVVLKIVSPDISHKSDCGGVAVGLAGPEATRVAYDRVIACVQAAQPSARIDGMLVCAQAPEGVEVIAGALQDAMFGPALMFGMGGIFAEVLQDVTFRVLPVTRADVEEMTQEIKGYPLLAGARGRLGCDLTALADLLQGVARLAVEHPGLAELDLNPVRVYARGAVALDARVIEKVG